MAHVLSDFRPRNWEHNSTGRSWSPRIETGGCACDPFGSWSGSCSGMGFQTPQAISSTMTRARWGSLESEPWVSVPYRRASHRFQNLGDRERHRRNNTWNSSTSAWEMFVSGKGIRCTWLNLKMKHKYDSFFCFFCFSMKRVRMRIWMPSISFSLKEIEGLNLGRRHS